MKTRKLSKPKALLILVCFLCLLVSKHSEAQSESYIQTVKGVIHPNDTCIVLDDKFADPDLWSTIKKNVTVQNVIVFELRSDTAINYNIDSFRCEIVFNINFKDSLSVEHQINNVHLSIQYDSSNGKPYKGIAYYKFKGGHEVRVTILSISSQQIDVAQVPYFQIRNQVLIDRIYKKRPGNPNGPVQSNTNSTSLNTAHSLNQQSNGAIISNNHQMAISWDPQDFEYDKFDLEYTYYDVKSEIAQQHFIPVSGIDQPLLQGAFKNNATRVTLEEPQYTINLVFPHGFLLIRIRAYTYDEVDGEWDRVEYPWHYLAPDGVGGTYAVYSINEHEDKLNWQYSAVFAEEGKRKEVVSYFDGSFKSRQTVTISNSDNVSIVQENVLDKLNRPAVSILPAPTVDNTIHYFPSFNKNVQGQFYSFADFNAGVNCMSTANILSTESGTSKYYSKNNPFANNTSYPGASEISKDIPDAEGYPMAVTDFTNDLTNRVRRQGGVGSAFQIGSKHETVYYYGKPSQTELDRLFGSEAGEANHYSKNMVVDPNGQVSVSYVDVAGKTVATALAGNSPNNVKPVSSNEGSQSVIRDELIHPQAIVRDAANKKISFNSTVLVPMAADYNFNYEFTGRSLQLIFGFNPEKKLCADCYYDVKFSISDECGQPINLLFNGNNYQELLVPASFNYGNNANAPNTLCGVVLPTQLGNIQAHFPKTGEYKVSYELSMSSKALDFYMEYLKQAQVMKTPLDFKKNYLQNLSIAGCFTDCRTCIEKLGEFDDFLIRIKQILQDEDGITVTTDDLEWIHKLYNEGLHACSDAIAKNCTIVDGCADQRKMMLKDVSPGGQYMLYDPGTLLFKERNINVFTSRVKTDANAPLVQIMKNGILTPVHMNTLEESEFISNFKPEWAYLLLPYHPEYCLLQECEAQSASRNRDKEMMNTDDDVEAGTKFHWDANESLYATFMNYEIPLIGAPYSQGCVSTHILSKIQSFAITSVRRPDPVTGFHDYILTDPNNPLPENHVSLREFIRFIVYCKNKPPEDANHQLPYIDLTCLDLTCPKPLEEWRVFRGLYIGIKQEAYRDPACKISGQDCGNCYIGVNAFSSLYNEKANPDYYPKITDFVIEENGSGGLQLKYKYTTPINNRCDVTLYKAVLTSTGVVATLQGIYNFAENQTTPFPISGGTINNKDLYFVEKIINNYNHNLDASNPSNCPKLSDFTFTQVGVQCNSSGNCAGQNEYGTTYIGHYPLLNQVRIRRRIYAKNYCINGQPNVEYHKEVFFDPFETGEKILTTPPGCTWNNDIEYTDFCVSTAASCISDPRWPSYFQKKRRFFESSTPEDINTVLNQNNNGSGTTPMGNTSTNYHQNCVNQAEGWIQKLNTCFDPTNPNTPALKDQLKQRLIAVCELGSDQTHPYGSSTTPAGQQTTPWGDRSFKDAIIAVMGAETPTCNSLLIDFPVPYGDATLLGEPIVNQLSECGYNLLVRFKSEWYATGGASGTYHTLNAYIKANYDPNFYLTDQQVQDLITSYLTHCPLKRAIHVPGLLTRCESPQTPTCLNCQQLSTVQAHFLAQYPQFNTSLPNYYELLAAYINQTYQMNVAPSAVYTAIESCKSRGEFNTDCNTPCSKFSDLIGKFFAIMPYDEYCKKAYCGAVSYQQMNQDLHNHLATWFNLNLKWNYDYSFYDSYYHECIKAILDRYTVCSATTYDCTCTPYHVSCCDDYPPLTMFKQLYPDPVDAKLLAFFFQLQSYRLCHPSNLPTMAYTTSYATLYSYFSNLVPNTIPNCSGRMLTTSNGQKSNISQDTITPLNVQGSQGRTETTSCNQWTFTFQPIPKQCGDLYDTVMAPHAYVLCSTPITPIFQSDNDACLRSTVNAALGNAEYAYSEYVKEFMRDYRESYFAKCLSITPSLLMQGAQHEYHYTLYYYDQSGNLVKTVPPSGVRLLSDADSLAMVGRLRDEDNADCYKNATAPLFNDNASHSLTVTPDFYPSHKDGPLTIESWIKFQNASNTQWIVNQFDDGGTTGKAGYYAYLKNGKLYFSIFGRSQEQWVKRQVQWLYPSMLPNVQAHFYNDILLHIPRYRQFSAICNTENNISSSGATSDFYHVVFQYNGDPQDPHSVSIYVNGVRQTLNWTDPGNGYSNTFLDVLQNIPSTSVAAIDEIKYDRESIDVPFTTASATPLIVSAFNRTIDGNNMNGFFGRIKQLRIYNSAPDAADIRRNSFDECLIPSTKEGLVLWLPLHRVNIDQASDVISGNTVTINAVWDDPAVPVYPMHVLPTYYAYNSLNQVIYQQTPDAGGSNFWYDRLGRLTVSQNSEQKTPAHDGPDKRYSYTLYDQLGRIAEVGEKLDADDIGNIDTKDDDQLANWLTTGNNRQITQTIYDNPDPNITADPDILLAQLKNYNSRKRVVTSIYREKQAEPDKFNFATHYVYDISGNVKRLYQENKQLPNGTDVNITKTIDYEFDPISGNVNQVWYQKAQQDQYLYRYYYDADNKLVKAISGRDVATLRTDSRYWYHLHGPLARTELGHDIVQGVDYAYTLQGWLKGINGQFINKPCDKTNFDLGWDGAPNFHKTIPPDVFGYTLGYYGNDYKPIDDRGGHHPMTISQFNFAVPGLTGAQLFNGNIAYTSYANRMIANGSSTSYSYGYDQLNRIVEMRNHKTLTAGQSWSWNTLCQDYSESVSYDPNGNILTYKRNGTAAQNLSMDNLKYNYQDNEANNKLDYISDGVPATNYAEDIDDQQEKNYSYDNIGNLIGDVAENITDIQWTVYGKIKKITKAGGTSIEYAYDASGNRVTKTVHTGDGTTNTYYFRDAQGNVLGVYEQADQWVWTEQHLYGSSRLGMWNPHVIMNGIIADTYDETVIGTRSYELTNHLGNVMAVVSDKKKFNGCLQAEVLTANDYYPFGMIMPGRHYSSSNYRYGFNGKENDNDVKGVEGSQQDYGLRIYDPRVGKFLSVDPLTRSYPWYSPYQFAGNTPIQAVDVDGGEPKGYRWDNPYVASHPGTGVSRIPSGYDVVAGVGKVGDYEGIINAYAVQDIDKKTYLIYEDVHGTRQWYVEYNKNSWIGSVNSFAWNYPGDASGALTAMTITPLLAVPGLLVYGSVAGEYIGNGALNLIAKSYPWWPFIGAIGRETAGALDESGSVGAANAGTPFFTNGSLEKFGNWVYGKLEFIGKSGNRQVLEAGGELVPEGKTLTINAAAYIQDKTNKESVGELGRDGLDALKDIYKNFAKENGFDKLIINYQRSEGSSSKNPGSSNQFVFDLNE